MRIESLENGRPEMRATLDRADRFLSLVGLLSAMLAAVAVAMAARRFMLRHLDACAMLRCLGLTQNQVDALYLIEFALVGLAGSVLGVLVGFGAHFVLLELIGTLLTSRPAAGVAAAGAAGHRHRHAAAGRLCAAAGAPAAQRAAQPRDPARAGGAAADGAGHLWPGHRRVRRAAAVAGGRPEAGAADGRRLPRRLRPVRAGRLAGAALLRRLRGAVDHQGWRFAVTSLQRRPGATVVQVVSLALGLMALLLLTVVRGDLMAAWRSATPPDAPNRFIINILPDQKADVRAPHAARRRRRAGAVPDDPRPPDRGQRQADHGEHLHERRRAAPGRTRIQPVDHDATAGRTNQIVAGNWYADAPGVAEASVEQGIAKTLGLKLGDMHALRYRRLVGRSEGDQPAQAGMGLDARQLLRHHQPGGDGGRAADLHDGLPPAGRRRGLANTLTRDFRT